MEPLVWNCGGEIRIDRFNLRCAVFTRSGLEPRARFGEEQSRERCSRGFLLAGVARFSQVVILTWSQERLDRQFLSREYSGWN